MVKKDTKIERARSAVAAVIRLAGKTSIGPSHAQFEDPFEGRGIFGILNPPVSPQSCCAMVWQSSVLPQLIEALAVNVGSYGYRFECLLKTEEQKKEAWESVKGEA